VTTATPSRASRPVAAPSSAAVRTGTLLVLTGVLTGYAVTALHPHREAPNDHAHVFAEYAASEDWIIVHLGQFLAGAVLLVGMLVLIDGLRSAGAPPAVARVATADERPEVWAAMTEVWPDYDEYQKTTSREIPVVVLERSGPS